jgi:phage replication-related protein YjqB (UPF0714/DUF867 family)
LLDANTYSGFVDLAASHSKGKDYDIFISPRSGSDVAIVAPHGGGIERGTSEIAEKIAGNDFNLYLFEGLKQRDNYETLHLSSHLFDEPECLSLISTMSVVVTIHGCNGKNETVYLGGLNESLKDELVTAFKSGGISAVSEGHKYPGKHPNNICNRGLTNAGVQVELTDTLRGTEAEKTVVKAIRNVLLKQV